MVSSFLPSYKVIHNFTTHNSNKGIKILDINIKKPDNQANQWKTIKYAQVSLYHSETELDDKSLGYTIMVITLAIMAAYFIWLFPGLFGTMFLWLALYSEWAIKLPVMLAVYMILFIVLWIGYTMATTPPPVPLDTPLDLDTEFDFDDEDEEEKEEKDE